MDEANTGIECRAMKFRLSRGGVRRSTRDKASEDMLKQTVGDEGQIVSRKLFQVKTSPVYAYQLKNGEMYQYHVAHTLPCGDDGTRLLNNAIYFEYTAKMSDFISQLDVLRARIVGTEDIYRQVVQSDIVDRNDALFNQGKPRTASVNDYASYSEMRNKLYVHWIAEPIATAGDFRFEVPEDMKKRYAENMAQMVENAKADVINRVIAPMQAFVARMSVPIGTDGSVFRDTMVTNLTDLVTHLPKLNIDDDKRITDMVQSIKNITSKFSSPDVLRMSQTARDTAKQDVETLMKNLTGGWAL